MNENRADIPTTPVPPAPPAGSRWGVTPMMRRPLPEMHINVFGIIGHDAETIKDTIADYQKKFGDDFQCCFHVTLNPASWRSHKRAGAGAK